VGPDSARSICLATDKKPSSPFSFLFSFFFFFFLDVYVKRRLTLVLAVAYCVTNFCNPFDLDCNSINIGGIIYINTTFSMNLHCCR
jgi:hypothetical protein